MDSKILRHVTGTGPMYIITLKDLNDLEECEPDDDFQSPREDIRKYVEKKPDENGDTLPVDTNTSNEQRNQLELMFPSATSVAITQAMDKTSNIHEAIEVLLRTTVAEEDCSSSESLPDMSTIVQGGQSLINQDHEKGEITPLEDYPLNISHVSPIDALNQHKLIVLDYSKFQEIYVDRKSESMLRDIFKKMKRGEIDAKTMVDVTFIGEDGIDAEGLTKEFFTIVMNSLECGTGGYVLFEGAPDHLLPIINEEYHQSGFFRYVGQLIAMSVMHAGFGLTGLSRALSVYIATDDITKASCHLSIEDVPDYSVQEILRELQGLDSLSEFVAFTAREDVSMLLYHAGFGNEILTSLTREKAIQCVLLHQVFRCRREQVEDIKQGLQEGLICTLIHTNLSCLSLVFPLNGEHSINVEDVLCLLHADDDLSLKQKQVLNWLKEYIRQLDVTGNNKDDTLQSFPTLQNLLQFTCGSPYPPNNGKPIHVKFITTSLPDADACFSVLKLPSDHESFDVFAKFMNIAINSQHSGFGRG